MPNLAPCSGTLTLTPLNPKPKPYALIFKTHITPLLSEPPLPQTLKLCVRTCPPQQLDLTQFRTQREGLGFWGWFGVQGKEYTLNHSVKAA